MSKMLSVAGTSLEVVERGQGRPLLFLHGGEGWRLSGRGSTSWLAVIG